MGGEKTGRAICIGAFALALSLGAAAAEPAVQPQRQAVRYGGSATAFQFAFLVAERLAAADGKLALGEATGTAGGARLLCDGVGLLFPDVALGSRPLSSAELNRCASHGVTDVKSYRFGLDGLALVAKADMPPIALTRRQLWLAMAAKVPVGGRLVANPYRRWVEIDPALPDLPILLVGPSENSGKIETVEAAVMDEGCQGAAEIAALPDADERRVLCRGLRKDEAYIRQTLLNTDYVARLLRVAEPAMAWVKFGEIGKYAGQVVPVPIDGLLPTPEALQDGHFPLVRSLYLHVKTQHAALVPGLRAFVAEFFSEGATGRDGYLVHAGLVPIPDRERQRTRAAITRDLGGGGEP